MKIIISVSAYNQENHTFVICKKEKNVWRVFEVLFKILFRIEGHKLSNQIACQMSKMGEKFFSFHIHAIETENELFPSDRCDQSV